MLKHFTVNTPIAHELHEITPKVHVEFCRLSIRWNFYEWNFIQTSVVLSGSKEEKNQKSTIESKKEIFLFVALFMLIIFVCDKETFKLLSVLLFSKNYIWDATKKKWKCRLWLFMTSICIKGNFLGKKFSTFDDSFTAKMFVLLNDDKIKLMMMNNISKSFHFDPIFKANSKINYKF